MWAGGGDRVTRSRLRSVCSYQIRSDPISIAVRKAAKSDDIVTTP
jgi:hypothetical protein